MIVFVGDKPSSKNTSPEIAFQGTKSMDTLVRWFKSMDIDAQGAILINSHLRHLLTWIRGYYKSGYKIVALGNNASSRLSKMRVPILHYKLPHPSGRNRLLNDKKFIDSELEKCKDYLKGR